MHKDLFYPAAGLMAPIRTRRALIYLNDLIELNADGAQALTLRGNLFTELEELDKAIADYNKTINLSSQPDRADYNNRGLAWLAKGEYDKAISDFNETIRLEPGFVDAYNNRGFAWDRNGDYDKAIADYSHAIRLDSKEASSYRKR